jgi:hypothetical protein
LGSKLDPTQLVAALRIVEAEVSVAGMQMDGESALDMQIDGKSIVDIDAGVRGVQIDGKSH